MSDHVGHVTAPAAGEAELDQRVEADFGGVHLLCRLWAVP